MIQINIKSRYLMSLLYWKIFKSYSKLSFKYRPPAPIKIVIRNLNDYLATIKMGTVKVIMIMKAVIKIT